MTNREVGNWIQGYLEYTKELESPDSYNVWTALSALASVVRRRVWLDQGQYILFANMYIALVGPPARTAKSTAIRMGRRLIREVPGVVIGPDACSREQLIRALAESKVDNQCSMTIHSSEFSSILDTSGILMIQLLTDLHDCDYMNPKGWRYETKTAGKDTIVNPYLNMLVGTTPSYIADAMPDNIHGHGFTSRTIFVYEDKERLINPRPKPPDKALIDALVNDLMHISTIGGEFRWTEGGTRVHDEWYRSLYDNPPLDHRLEGYHWRKKIHALKVAMLLSIAERDELVLDEMVIKTAIQLLNDIEPNLSRTFSAVGKYEHASALERVAAQIMAARELPTEEIYRRNYFEGSRSEVQEIISAVCAMGLARLEIKNKREWAVAVGTTLPWINAR